VQTDIAQYYESNFPGQVQVVGVDCWNGLASDVRAYKNVTGVTFPLLLNGSAAAGGNFYMLYGDYDNYIVVNKQGVVRYHAAQVWPHGNRYHLNEIRGSVDSLVAQVVGVEPGDTPEALRLTSAPNPARGASSIELSIPAGGARSATVTVYDIGGRKVATAWEGAIPAGITRFPWSGTGGAGARLAPGVYVVRARVDSRELVHRIVVLP
jgi:flagellar hook capping protein FlgD